jgi:hypothetical protein
MKIFCLILISSLISLNLGDRCTIANSKYDDVKSYEDCQTYTTSSTSKLCCYVNGVDDEENPISACAELTGTVKGALKDLDEVEGYSSLLKNYYLNADCHLDKEISLCDPDDRKSDTPLSADYCSKYPTVLITGVDEDFNCCYVSGVSVDKKNVYSCVGIEPIIYTIEERKNEIESGNFERLGALTDIKIECTSSSSANFHSISIISLIISILIILS